MVVYAAMWMRAVSRRSDDGVSVRMWFVCACEQLRGEVQSLTITLSERLQDSMKHRGTLEAQLRDSAAQVQATKKYDLLLLVVELQRAVVGEMAAMSVSRSILMCRAVVVVGCGGWLRQADGGQAGRRGAGRTEQA